MSEQLTSARVVYDPKRNVTNRERVLTETDAAIPWAPLQALVALYYPKVDRGRRQLPPPTMLRVYFFQQWFDLSDPKTDGRLYVSVSMRRFARVELGEDPVPDESTILRFRHLLEQHDLPSQIFDTVRASLEDYKLLLKVSTIVDATIIAAPGSTNSATKTRDPGMKPTRKGNKWYFGMKASIGTDTRGLVHSLTATHSASADLTQLDDLLHRLRDRAVRRHSLLEEIRSAAVGAQRRPVSHQPALEADGSMGSDQPEPVGGPCARRACFSRREATMRFRHGAVSWLGDEHGGRDDDLRAGQLVSGALQVGVPRHVVSARTAPTGLDRASGRY